MKKLLGKLNMFVAIVLFSIVWFGLSLLSGITKPMDYGWDEFVANLPARLYKVHFAFSSAENPDLEEQYRFLYGKHITKKATGKVIITAIDDYTVEKYGYPFKRKYYGILADKLKGLGVKAIGMDVMLFNPDRDNPENDRKFAEATARTGIVVNVVGVDMYTRKITKAIEPLEKVSAVIAHPNVDETKDQDGQVRRYAPFYPAPIEDPSDLLTYAKAGLTKVRCWKDCKDVTLPSLGIAPYAIYSGKPLLELEMVFTGEKILNYRYPLPLKNHPGWDKDPKNRDLKAFPHVSAADIIEDRLSSGEKEALKGAITFIGSTALGAYDHVPGLFFRQMPGVDVHATFLDNLLAGDFREELDLLVQTLLFLLLPWLPVVLRRYSISTMVYVSSGVVLALLVSYMLLLSSNVVMPFMSILFAFLLPAAWITVDKGLAEGREKKWIKNTFGQYLSPKVVDLITKDPSKLSLGGEKRDMTAFFLDLAGFTTMSEKLSPEELTAMLNEYLSAFTEVILKHDGTVDKYIGDCVVAFWNAPLDQADHRKRGVLAAIDCQSEMARLNESLTQFAIKPKCRVGVNSGFMVVGNMGSRSRLSYTVMGDTVNMASRMEGANKYFHSKIMTSEYTFDDIKGDFDHRYLGSIRVVGKVIPVKVYEPFARKGEAPADVMAMLKHYNAGQEKFFKADYAGAMPHFKAALEARPGDGPSEFYLQKSELFAREVPKEYDGSFNLTEKG